VIVAGGGVILSAGRDALRAVAEHLGACVVTTMQGKSVFPENHPLYAWHMGTNATSCGNFMTSHADVLLAVGVRFADKAAASYKPGSSFSIPPTRLIHADIDPAEIGKNYPVEVGIVGDARAVLEGLLEALRSRTPARAWAGAPYAREIADHVARWWRQNEELRTTDHAPVTMGRVITELRRVLPPEAVVFTSSGNIQAQVFQEMPFTQPRTYRSAGGFSTMGWSFPAAMGAKLALPDTPVVALVGDGDFLMTIQELATAVQYNIPVIVVVLNNVGWQSIRDLQVVAYGEESVYSTMFEEDGGQPVTPDIAAISKGFGAHAVRISRPDEVAPALNEAIALGRPSVLEIMVDDRYGTSGGLAPGWWDVPVPEYMAQRRAKYEQERSDERI